jgi:hypothetical protein
LCSGQNPPLLSGASNQDEAPKTKRQIKYPARIHTIGAIHEIALLLFFACTEVALTVADAVGLVSAMILIFSVF